MGQKLNLKMVTSGRKRFLKSAPLADIYEWQNAVSVLKNFLFQHTSFQIVSEKIYLEVHDPGSMSVMLEVIGVPTMPEKSAYFIADVEGGPLFLHEQAHGDLFTLDFKELFFTSKVIKEALNVGENQLSAIFHIVFDDEKIEFHFFRQKDYIQILL
jgi:hypothetical protein